MSGWDSENGFEAEEPVFYRDEMMATGPGAFYYIRRYVGNLLKPGMGMWFFVCFAFCRACFYYFGIGRRVNPDTDYIDAPAPTRPEGLKGGKGKKKNT